MGKTETAREETSLISFAVLGPIEVYSPGGGRCALGGTKAERLLAVLLLEANHVVPVHRLISAIWDEEPPNTAAHQVRKTVAELRKRLPAGDMLLITDGPGYRINPEREQVDLLRFRFLLEQARRLESDGQNTGAVECLQQALALWRGEVLAGTGGFVIEAAAETLREEHDNALERLYSLRLSLGEAETTLPELRDATARHPYRERLRGLLMLALYRCGRQAEALSEFENTRKLLAREMGIAPGPELCNLHEAILRADPELMPLADTGADQHALSSDMPFPALAGLPYDLADFAGREREVEELLDLSRIPTGLGPRIVSVDGMGGVGKTALVVHAGHILAPEYPDGQIYLDLHGFSPSRRPETPGAALGVMLRALGVSGDRIPDDLDGRILAWRSATAGCRLLMILDNAADTEQIRPLLPATSQCLILMTSRMHLLDLDGAYSITMETLDEAAGFAMVRMILGDDAAREVPDAIAELVRACGGLPLALRLTLARLRHRRHWDLRHLVERLLGAGALDQFASGERSVRASLSLSYETLGEEHQRAFRLFALYPGADLDAATAGALLGSDAGHADRLLEDLLDVHMLQQHERDRYSLHDLVRAFAESLRGTGTAEEEQAALQRLTDYWGQASEIAGNILFPGRANYFGDTGDYGESPIGSPFELTLSRLRNPQDAVFWFQRERDSIVNLLRASQRVGLDRKIAMIARNLGAYLSVHDHYTEAFEVGGLMVQAAQRLGDKTIMRVALLNHAVNFWALGQYAEGLAIASKAQAIAADTADRYGEAVCMSRIGIFRIAMGDPVGAMEPLRSALEIQSQEAHGKREVAVTLSSLAEASNMCRSYSEAAEFAAQALAIQRSLGDVNGEIAAMEQLAESAVGRADWPQARHWLGVAAGLCDQYGSPSLGQLIAARMALVLGKLGDDRAADKWITKATTEKNQIAVGRRAAVEAALGAVYLAKEQYQEARERYRAALEAAGQDDHERARALFGLATASRGLGEDKAARDYAVEADRLFTAMGITSCCVPGRRG
jgi:DNA-binding SARP family transcriptional activator